MPVAWADPGATQLSEIRQLAFEYYRDEQMPIYATQRIKVMTLASRLGDPQSWFASATAVRALHRSSDSVIPMQEISDYLKDLKRVLDAHWEAADDRPTAAIT